jgi:hypothetical protein
MKGKVWSPIHVNPRVVRLRGVEGDNIEQVVHIKGEKKEPLSIEILSNSIPDKLDLELKKAGKDNSYELKVKNRVKKEKNYLGKIKLKTNYLEKPEILIQVVGYIRSKISVRPRVLIFKPLPEKQINSHEERKKLSRPVVVFLNKGNNLKIEKVTMQSSLFKVNIREIQEGKRVELLIEPIFEKLKKGLNIDYLKIFIQIEKPKVVVVPIRIKVL